MLKNTVDRFKHYVVDFRQVRSILSSKKHQKCIKVFYKKTLVNSLYLKRQNVNLYKPLPKFDYNHFFIHNILVKKKRFVKGDVRLFFFWNACYVTNLLKISKERYVDFFDLFFSVFPKTNLTSFKYYWLTAFLAPNIKTRFFYFTNRIKFFTNQRLVKQSVLILYNATDKNNTYSNNSRFFKSLLFKKKINTLFLFKSVIFQLYPKFGKRSYFLRHHNFIKKFVTNTYLQFNAYIAQW